MTAFKLPKKSDEEKKIRLQAIEKATQAATLSPLNIMEKTQNIIQNLIEIAEKGNQNSLSDAGVALLNARAAIEGAYMNVLINLAGITDNQFKESVSQKSMNIHQETIKNIEQAVENIYSKLKEQSL